MFSFFNVIWGETYWKQATNGGADKSAERRDHRQRNEQTSACLSSFSGFFIQSDVRFDVAKLLE